MDSKSCVLQLNEARKKLTHLMEQLDKALQCNSNLGVGMEYILSTVNELHSLMNWTVGNQELKEERDAVILQKLQQITRIQEDLLRAAAQSEETHASSEQENVTLFSPQEDEEFIQNLLKDTEDIETCDKFPKNGQESTTTNNQNLSLDRSNDLIVFHNEENSIKIEEICSDSEGLLHSLGTNISEDEGLGEECKRSSEEANSIPNSGLETGDDSSFESPLLNNEINILETNEREDTRKWMDIDDHNDCLNFSTTQRDKNHIAELQADIIMLLEDNKNLKSELQSLRLENSSLKEQVLELEEAENDSRCESQRLEHRLYSLQRDYCKFEAQYVEMKHDFAKYKEKLKKKENSEKELRSKLKQTENIIETKDSEIKTMEEEMVAIQKKLLEEEDEISSLKIELTKPESCEKGTQSYILSGKFFKSLNKNSSAKCDEEKVDKSVQVSHDKVLSQANDCGIQTDNYIYQVTTHLVSNSGNADAKNSSLSKNAQEFSDDCISTSNKESSEVEELLKRMVQMAKDDAHMQQQLQHIGEIIRSLYSIMGELTNAAEDSEYLVNPIPREGLQDEKKDESSSINKGIISRLDQSEQEIKERFLKLKEISEAFEKKLETRRKLCLEMKKKILELEQTEHRILRESYRLIDERDCLVDKLIQLYEEKKDLVEHVCELKWELETEKSVHQMEITKIRVEQEKITSELQQKVENLRAKEKEQLKHITSLKLEKTKEKDKNESDRLKSSYIELQLELKRTRDELKKKEQELQNRLEECESKYTANESRLKSELEKLGSKNSYLDETIQNFMLRAKELKDMLNQKKEQLLQARDENKTNISAIEKQYPDFETQLEKQLQEAEEGTLITGGTLRDDQLLIEKELRTNIEDLRRREEQYKFRMGELESKVAELHEELRRITTDMASNCVLEVSSGGISSLCRERLLKEINYLLDREADLREKLQEMEEKEAAYKETLLYADRIVASVEQGYRNRIEELETSERNLIQRIAYFEELESHLNGKLRKERESSDGRTADELVKELLEAEARENGLKEKIETLEELQRSSLNKVKDLEKLRDKLEAELNEKDELSSNIHIVRQELEASRKALAASKKIETDLMSAFQQMQNRMASSESETKDQIRTLEEEKSSLVSTIEELRAQVRELNSKVEKMSYEVDDKEISVAAIQNQTPVTNGISLTNKEDFEDIIYAEVEDYSDNFRRRNIRNPSSSSAINSSRRFNIRRRTEDEAAKGMLTDTNEPDSYDSARKNLEDCILRAIAAMEKDLENKKLSKRQRDRRMKALLAEAVKTESSPPEVASSETSDEDPVYDVLLPSPTNLQVVRRLRNLLSVRWEYINTSLLAGYKIFVNGELHHDITVSSQTYTHIPRLDMSQSIQVSICAVSHDGVISDPAFIDVHPVYGWKFQPEDAIEVEEEEEEEEDGLADEPTYGKKRPFSMEW